MSLDHKRVFGIDFSALSKDEIVEAVIQPQAVGGGVKLIVTTNMDHVVNLVRNRPFREAYDSAWLATTDGAPVYLYAKFRRSPVRERVAGSDFFASLMPRLIPGQHRPYFMVSNPQTADKIRGWLTERGFAADAIGTVVPPFGFEKDPAVSDTLAEAIRSHGATHLIMGVGSPKSELWVHTYRDRLGDLYAFGIGAGVDFFVGLESRAPAWMQHAGLEWSWRLAHEPKRLWKRYLVDSWLFFVAIRNDLATGGAAPVKLS